jgi:tetratricopeptide (TPR) repeat protein
MNRSERRAHQKLRGRTTRGPDTFALRALLDQGKQHHQAGRLSDAERSYRLALDMAPAHPEALHLLGLLAYRVNQLDQAIDLITQAIEEAPTHPLYWFNLGVVTQRAGKKEDAVRCYERALDLNPKHVEALINLGNVFKDLHRLDEALTAYRKALVLQPNHADTHNNLGVALKEQRNLKEAIAAYREALRRKPMHLEAMNNLALALMDAGDLDEAISLFEQALTVQSDYAKALYNLGIAWIWKGEHSRAIERLTQAAQAKHHHGKPVTESVVYRSRLKHDVEQVKYLLSRQMVGPEAMGYLQALEQLDRSVEARASDCNRCPVAPHEAASIAPSFNRFLYLPDCGAVPSGALNGRLDVADVECRYLAKQPEVTFIDDLLQNEALAALRQFCWEATIWKKDYENGYLGAFLGDGFATPLLLQIAEELRLTFPNIFKQHRLTQAWAFKQDSARRGLNIHADAAAVNVNFWITDNEANLNPDTGGLVVYDKEAPSDWDFAEYNSDRNKPKILQWLQQSGAEAIRIPYRANRAVVFNSDLFHETDDVTFKDDYVSRRINITLLYGHRHQH